MSFYSNVSSLPIPPVMWPRGVAVDSGGNIYVADVLYSRITKTIPPNYKNVITFAYGPFYYPFGVAVDSSGNFYVADAGNHKIHKITPSGLVSTLAGSGVAGDTDGQGTSAQFNQPTGVAVDSSGNVYVADAGNHKIRKITPSGLVSTLAGSGVGGYTDGQGTAAQFYWPHGIAVDSGGTIYVADTYNYKIRKITPSGLVSTLAGSGVAGDTDGQGSYAQFDLPTGVAVDSSGNVYVADFKNNKIRKITPSGLVNTLAGSGVEGWNNGHQGSAAQFKNPFGVAVDSSGNVYVADSGNSSIRKIEFKICDEPTGLIYVTAICTPGSNTVFSVAQTSCTNSQFNRGFSTGSSTTLGSPGTCTQCSEPTGTQFVTSICTSTTDTVFSNARPTCNAGEILKNFTAGSSTTLGSIGVCSSTCDAGSYNNNGVCETCPSGFFSAAGASICSAACPAGTLSVIESACLNICPAGKWYNSTLLQCNTCPSGTFYVGPGATSMNDCMSCGPGTYSGIGFPSCSNCPVGTSFAGTSGTSDAVCTPCPAGQYSDVMGSETCSVCPGEQYSYVGSSFCSKLNTRYFNARTRKIIKTVAGIAEDRGLYVTHTFIEREYLTTLGNMDIYDELVITATNVYSKGPRTLVSATYTIDPNQSTTGLLDRGSVYTTDYGVFQSGTVHYIIVYLKTPCPASAPNWDPLQKKCVAACSVPLSHATSNVCTKCPTLTQVRSIPTRITRNFNLPGGVAVDSAGNIYVSDTYNNEILKIRPSGLETTLAGSGTAGFADIYINLPGGVAVDSVGNIYVSDFNNNKIRKITPSGLVSTLAGSGTAGFADGQGTAAQFQHLRGVAVDSRGDVYVADSSNHRIRKITPDGTVSTFAGSGTVGTLNGSGTAAQFNQPSGITIDSSGNFYVADAGNHKIRKITLSGDVSTLAGSGTEGFADGQGTAAQFKYPFGVAVDSGGTVYVADKGNHRIRKITPSGDVSTLTGSGYQRITDGQGTAAQFSSPSGIAVDSSGNVYVADTHNNKIHKITPTGRVSTIVTTGGECEPGFTLSGTTCNGTSLTCPDQLWTLSGSLCTKTELICPNGSLFMEQNFCLFSNGVSALQTSVDLIRSATSTQVSKPAYGACVTDCPVNTYKREDCVQCPGNQVTTSAGATSVTACVCPVGTYGTNGSGVCTPCGQDQTSPQGTQTQAGCFLSCPVGSYASSTSTCTVCPYGTSPAGSTSISACVCAPGMFLSGGMCVAQCPVGMYGDNGTRSCIQCPGTQTSALGSVGISACVCPDDSGGLNGSGVCIPCTGGQVSTLTDYTCPDDSWTLTGSVCSKVSDYDCTGVSYDDIIESGQLLEPAEIDIGTTTRAFTTQPVRNGITSFTFSLDINIERETPGVWRDIFQNISGVTWPITNSNMRKPSLHISDSWISFVYSTNPGTPPADYNLYADSNYNVVPGTWFKCTCTVDGPNRTIAMYINGQKQSEKTATVALDIPSGAPAFTWRPVLENNNGYMKVKNVYWWNQVLSSDAIKLFAGLPVPGACYKTANTCYSTTYTCPTSACVLSGYTCPDSSWTLNGSVCLKPGQNMTAPTVTCSCPVSPAQYTCPSGWTLEGNRCKRFSYYSCDNGGSEYDRDPITGWTTLKSAWKLEGTKCKRYTCNADTSQAGTYLTINGNSCKLYNSTYVCEPDYRQEPYAGSFATALAEIPGCNKWLNITDDYDAVLTNVNGWYYKFEAVSKERDYCIDYDNTYYTIWPKATPRPRRPVIFFGWDENEWDIDYTTGMCRPVCNPNASYSEGARWACNKPYYYHHDRYNLILHSTYRATPYYIGVLTTLADEIDATLQYDYIPADPVMGDQNADNATLTRTQAQVMAIQTTNATTGSVQGRQCMCSGTSGTYMDLLNKNCVTRCPVATYTDYLTGTCKPCPANQTSPEGSGSINGCKCSYATPYWTGFSCMQQLNPSAIVTGSGFTTRYEDKYTFHEFTESGSFTLLSPIIAKLWLVGGGAGGSSDGYPGGGGDTRYLDNMSMTGGTYDVTVGSSGRPGISGGTTSLRLRGASYFDLSVPDTSTFISAYVSGGLVLTDLISSLAFRFINLGESTILYCQIVPPAIDSFNVTNNAKKASDPEVIYPIKSMNDVNTSPAPTLESCAQECLDISGCVGFTVDLRYNLACTLYNYDFPVAESPDQRYVYKKK